MRENISFKSRGLECRGWLYLPDDIKAGTKCPTIIMAHGFSAVKEQGLADFAEHFVKAGFAVLVFDYRFFGDSEGEPRCQIFPLEMVEDYRNAISWVSEHTHVDRDRIGIWGTSYSGGLVAYVGAIDKRAKAVVAQVPSIIGPESRRNMNPEKWDNLGDFLLQDRISRYSIGKINYLKVVAPEGEPCILPGKENHDALMGMAGGAPNWRNEITVESLEKIREFDPVSRIHMIAPRALLVIAAEEDNLIPLEAVKDSYEKASEPKDLTVYPILHFDIYTDPWQTKAANAAIDWFKTHLI
ncbi:alpha/beta hydrolase [Sedimenticola selenatireducens]|uniref:Alpha/beta hydrolase n=1 Tax=Sedimenticola selenatireducens TaxID=191960 RepID=A0A557S4J5_9GAMM|nr:alpha/beta hydrolase [Sedimenticola selenatireducens]TVO72257.1 alpha/beta hydrolase [Sedimenticola selenatireducens]TVT61308.1 MAG: alpha/beta hydrolase [Sedimenticola selenatireducens]